MPFYFFFGLLGLVIGALITWFLLANHPFESLETPGGPVDDLEAGYLVGKMAAEGKPVDEATITRLLELHGGYVDGLSVAPEEAPAEGPAAGQPDEPSAEGSAEGSVESQNQASPKPTAGPAQTK